MVCRTISLAISILLLVNFTSDHPCLDACEQNVKPSCDFGDAYTIGDPLVMSIGREYSCYRNVANIVW